jgi:hypothetical protein
MQGARLQSLSQSQKTDDSNFLCVGFSLSIGLRLELVEKARFEGEKNRSFSLSPAAHNREDVLFAAARCLVSVKGQKAPATSLASYMYRVIYIMEPNSPPSNLRITFTVQSRI